jgi:hypothetical protein
MYFDGHPCFIMVTHQIPWKKTWSTMVEISHDGLNMVYHVRPWLAMNVTTMVPGCPWSTMVEISLDGLNMVYHV